VDDVEARHQRAAEVQAPARSERRSCASSSWGVVAAVRRV
jgi:hypothetical protein